MNPVKALTRDTHEVTNLGDDEVFTAAEAATAIKGIKSGTAAGEDEIRPEMLKTLTGEGILWLTRVCQVAWKFGKTPRDWQTGVIIPIFKKRDRKQCTNYRGYHSLVCQGKYMPNALKEMPRNSGIKTGRWSVRFSSGSQHHEPNLHFEANFREILGAWQRSLCMLCRS